MGSAIHLLAFLYLVYNWSYFSEVCHVLLITFISDLFLVLFFLITNHLYNTITPVIIDIYNIFLLYFKIVNFTTVIIF